MNALIESTQELLRFAIAERDAFYDCSTDAEGNLNDPGDQAELERMDAMIDRARAALSDCANDREPTPVNLMFSTGHKDPFNFTASDRRFFVSYPAPPSVAVPEDVVSACKGLLEHIKCIPEHRLLSLEDNPRSPSAMFVRAANLEVALTAAPSPDHSGDANKMVDDLPVMRGQSDLSGGETDADHIADAGKVVPIGYLTNQAVARLQSDERLNGEHLYAFKPDDLSKFQAVYLAPTVNESLTIEDFNGMCRIVEAVSQMTDGFVIDQCHIDRAREIVQDATRLRTAGDEGEEDPHG